VLIVVFNLLGNDAYTTAAAAATTAAAGQSEWESLQLSVVAGAVAGDNQLCVAF